MKTILILLALVVQAHAITYEVSLIPSGGGGLFVTDWTEGVKPPIYSSQSVTFGTLKMTLDYDPVAQTLRQVGSVPLIVENPGILQTNRFAGPDGTVTITQAFSGPATFDTGVQKLTLLSENHAVFAEANNTNTYGGFGLPSVNALYSLETGGETYSGVFSYRLFNAFLYPFYDIVFSEDLSSLTLSQLWSGSGSPGQSGESVFVTDITDHVKFTAPNNGFSIDLNSGLDDHRDYFRWSSGTVTAIAAAVPDAGSTIMLLGLSLAGLLCYRRRLA